MKTIVYKMRLNRYECVELHDDGSDEIKFVFEHPINAKMLISESVVNVCDGIGITSTKKLPEGDVTPKLFLGSGVYILEGFTVSRAAVIRKPADENYIRNLGKFCEELSQRVEKLEKRDEELQTLITQKINL